MKSVMKRAVLAAVSVLALGATSVMALEPGYRKPDPRHTLVLDTTKGQVIVEMYPQVAPNHVVRLTTLTRQGFYDGMLFDRVIEGFMAQVGQRSEKKSNLGTLKGEFTVRHDATFPMTVIKRPSGTEVGYVGSMPVQSQTSALSAITNDGKVKAWGLFCEGVLGMARTDDPDSADGGFFLTRGQATFLEKRYTAFGVVISGADAVRKFKTGEPPASPDSITRARVLADIPEAERPDIQVMDTASPQFATYIEGVRKEKGEQFSICDVTVPSKVTPPATAPTPVATN